MDITLKNCQIGFVNNEIIIYSMTENYKTLMKCYMLDCSQCVDIDTYQKKCKDLNVHMDLSEVYQKYKTYKDCLEKGKEAGAINNEIWDAYIERLDNEPYIWSNSIKNLRKADK